MLELIRDRLASSGQFVAVEVAESLEEIMGRATAVDDGTIIVVPWREKAHPNRYGTGAHRLGDSIAAAGATAVAASDEIAGVGTAGATSAADMLAAADASAEYGSAIQMIRAAVQPMVAEHVALQDAVRTLTVLEDAGAISAREAALAHDLVARQAIELSARMDAAGVSIDGTTASMARQATSAQQMINSLTGVDRATGQTVAETLRHGQALDQLRAKYNPLFAASRQYEVALGEIAEAERLGAISTMEAAGARDRAAAALAPVPDQLTRVGASSGAAANHVANLSFQMNDIGTMLASGQSPFMLMVQQGPQVVQVLGQMRQSGMALGTPSDTGTDQDPPPTSCRLWPHRPRRAPGR